MLEKLRAKPDHVKKSISLVLTVLIFLGILFVWISSWDARMHDEEIRNKTVSPVAGVTSMFDGFISGFKEIISGAPSYIDLEGTASSTALSATSTSVFDVSGVVVIDGSATTTTPQE